MNETKEIFEFNPKGIVQINQVKDGQIIKSETVDNLIVNRSHTIVRDLLYNGDYSNTLNVLQVGDMGLEYTADLDNLDPPSVTDVSLVNKIYECNAEKVTRFTDQQRYCMRLEFSIPKTEANNKDSDVYYSLVAEYGLMTRGLYMFSRLVKPIVKTRDIALDITWTIYI